MSKAPKLNRSSRCIRETVRQALILQEFLSMESDESEPDWQAVAEHAIYLPPWSDGPKMPFYGPRTESQFQRSLQHYLLSRAGGGLWDFETEAECHTKAALRQAVRRRQDYEAVSSYVRTYRHQIPKKELEMFYAYFEDEKSLGIAAKQLGVAKSTAKELLRRLRKRVAGCNPLRGVKAGDEQ